MNYKNIFKRAFLLISSPAKAWEDISIQWDSQRIIIDFVYPMIGFCGLTSLIGSLVRHGWNTPLSFQYAMINCCGIAVALFGGFYLASYLLNQCATKWMHLTYDLARSQTLVGYAMSVIFIVYIVLGFFPSLQLIGGILELYVFYIIYVGTPIMVNISSSLKIKFTLCASLLILICPSIIQFIYNKLVVIFN